MKKTPRPEKTYEYIIEHVKNEIYRGNLVVGQKLPPEREMAEVLGVGRNAVREAMRSLSVLGFVSSAQGAGNFVTCDFRRSFQDSIHMMLVMEETTYPQINELRHSLESYSAKAMARNLTLETERKLKDLLERMERSEDPAEGVKLDSQLHHLISENSKNAIIANLVQGISPVLDEEVYTYRLESFQDPAFREKTNTCHRKIIEGILENDPGKIDAAFDEHMRNTYEYDE